MISADFPNPNPRKYGRNSMMMDPYPHPQHMKDVKHLSYVVRGCGNQSMRVWSLAKYTIAPISISAKQ
jgi:hypothetical protein